MADGKSKADADQTEVGAGASGTASQSRQSDTGAGATTRGAGAESGSSGAQTDTTQNIAENEAYIINMKRTVANELDYDVDARSHRERMRRNGEDLDQRKSRNGEDYDQSMRELTQQHFQNAIETHDKAAQMGLDFRAGLQAQTLAERERTVRHGDLASDRMWNMDEVSMAALSSTVAVAVAQALSAAKGGE